MAALVGIAADLRAILAAHIPFQFMDRRRLRPTDNIQCHRLVGVTAQAADLKVEIPYVDIAERLFLRGRELMTFTFHASKDSENIKSHQSSLAIELSKLTCSN